LLLLYFPQEQ